MACHCETFSPGDVVGILEKLGLTLALAESCTGGMIAAKITGIPGSSRYFSGGVVAYSNLVKEKVLGVSVQELSSFGAVSEEVALSMAIGIKKLVRTSIGLSVTGIAGPGGGTQEKPVGLVYIALDGPWGSVCSEMRLKGDRSEVRTAATIASLEFLYSYLKDNSNKH